MSGEYRHLLSCGDKVLVTMRRGDPRHGQIDTIPQSSRQLRFKVRLDGLAVARYFLVTDLRKVVDGKPEENPPFEGSLPVASGYQPDHADGQNAGDVTDMADGAAIEELAQMRTTIYALLDRINMAILERTFNGVVAQKIKPVAERFDELDDLFSTLSSLGSPNPKGELAQEVQRMREDTARAAAAADKLFKSGKIR